MAVLCITRIGVKLWKVNRKCRNGQQWPSCKG
nr:MAG TPA: hypothetical protein [Caudoviricetes sp.]